MRSNKGSYTPSGTRLNVGNPPPETSGAEARILGASTSCPNKALEATQITEASQRPPSPAESELSSLMDTLDITPQKNTRPKLSGACKKRIKKLRQSGMSYSEALKQALAKGTNQTASGSKRQRSDGSTPDQPTKQMKGNTGHSSNYPTFRDALSTIRIAVLDAAFPEVVLTSSQLDSVKKAINEAIFSTEHSTPPNFNGCLYRGGYLVLLCLDQASANWLLQTAPTLRPWVGATLRAVDEKEVPRGKLIEGLFPDAAKISTEGLLKLITSQNPTCRVPLWRILERRNIGHAAKLVVSVDHTTYRALQAKGLKVSFGIEQVAFRPRSSYRKPPSRKRDTGQPGPGNATGQPASKHGKKTESKKRNVETSENPQRNKAQSTSAKKGPNLGPEERQKPTPVPTSNPKDSTSTPAGPSGKSKAVTQKPVAKTKSKAKVGKPGAGASDSKTSSSLPVSGSRGANLVLPGPNPDPTHHYQAPLGLGPTGSSSNYGDEGQHHH
ncbi:uncharacterized protein LOC129809404 [Phlebotomus papatasi]|uniref:uncharacterized protein LOC129809404 n=1 Tax=Phlebotomus papatasi TaxID=29031 RepID=UPI002483B491|nr:uncharacterized protein LOC129809404 [Phlebotomus papatasi]